MLDDLDAWKCRECDGEGLVRLEREGIDWRDIVITKEHCDACDGIGWQGPDAALAAKQGVAIDPAVVLWQAMNEAEKVGNRTDDKLIVKFLRRAGYCIAAAPAPEAQPVPCNVCGGSKTVEQFTSAAAPVQKVKCFACGGTGKRSFNCFADKNPEAEWIRAEQQEQAAPAPEAQPCLITGTCKHGSWCSEVYCQEHCQFVEAQAAGQELPPLPEPVGKVAHEAREYELPWVSSEDAFDGDQMHAYARAALAQRQPLPADIITVNLVRLVGLDKHKARECEAVVRAILGATTGKEPGNG